MFFNKFNGFLGIINSVTSSEVTSVLVYFTNLWASVATNVKLSGLNWKNTPLITGRKSSFPAANIVLEIAEAKILPEITVVVGVSISTDLGNSFPSK